jgi:hypothetical protein
MEATRGPMANYMSLDPMVAQSLSPSSLTLQTQLHRHRQMPWLPLVRRLRPPALRRARLPEEGVVNNHICARMTTNLDAILRDHDCRNNRDPHLASKSVKIDMRIDRSPLDIGKLLFQILNCRLDNTARRTRRRPKVK